METPEDIAAREQIEKIINAGAQGVTDTEKKELTPREAWLMKTFGTLTPNRHQRRRYTALLRRQKKAQAKNE